MVTAIEPVLRNQLVDRREKLQAAANGFHRPAELTRLLHEVDEALGRMDMGIYGLCEVCHDSVETERLIADPLTRVCIDHLSAKEQRALVHRQPAHRRVLLSANQRTRLLRFGSRTAANA